jgi:hypothetical protein
LGFDPKYFGPGPFGLGVSATTTNRLASLLGDAPATAPATKRKAFFSFHFDDIMRVNVVRNAWKITHPDNALMRSFYDSSLWQRREIEGDGAVKRLIREGVQYTSAVCVLIGTGTWLRRWVRYEMARAIVDGRAGTARQSSEGKTRAGAEAAVMSLVWSRLGEFRALRSRGHLLRPTSESPSRVGRETLVD